MNLYWAKIYFPKFNVTACKYHALPRYGLGLRLRELKSFVSRHYLMIPVEKDIVNFCISRAYELYLWQTKFIHDNVRVQKRIRKER